MVRPPIDSSPCGGSESGSAGNSVSQRMSKKIRYMMRKWVDRCRKSGMVLNPPLTTALFFESLVPSRDRVNSVQTPKEISADRNGFDSGKAKIELCVIRQDIWVKQKLT